MDQNINPQQKEQIELLGNRFKKEKKKNFISTLISMVGVIVLEIVFILMLKLKWVEVNIDNFTVNLIMYILIVLSIFQVSFIIYTYLRFVKKVLKMNDYQAGLYKMELDKSKRN